MAIRWEQEATDKHGYVASALNAIDAARTAITHLGVSDCEGDFRSAAMDACSAAIESVRKGHSYVACDHKPVHEYTNSTGIWRCACGTFVFARQRNVCKP